MSTKINARSPYYIKFSDANLHTVDLDLYIWEGLNLNYKDQIDSIQSRTYAAMTTTSTAVTISGAGAYFYNVGLKFQIAPTSGTYYAICYKDGDIFKEFDNISIDGSGYFTLSVSDMTDGVYTFDFFYNSAPTSMIFYQLSGGKNDYVNPPSGFTSAPTSIAQTISSSATSGTPKYSFSKNEIGTNNYVVFEISEYIKDYLITEYNSYATDIVWVKWDYTIKNAAGGTEASGTDSDYLGLGGYGYFEEGVQPQLNQQVLQSNTTIYYNDGQNIIFPVWAEYGSTIELVSSSGANIDWDAVDDFWDAVPYLWGKATTPQTIVDNGNSNQKIQYVIIEDTEFLDDGDTITVTSGLDVVTLTLKKVCEPKYTPLNVIFFNKFGALQNLWLFKKSATSLDVTADKYKRNIMEFDSNPTYSTVKHQSKRLNVNGNEYIVGNTGFLNEEHNEVIRELMLSQEVWIDNGVDILPVNPKTTSTTFKTSVNDKLIQYTIEFDYAFDKINNIR